MTGRIVLDLADVTDEEKQWALHRAVNGRCVRLPTR